MKKTVLYLLLTLILLTGCVSPHLAPLEDASFISDTYEPIEGIYDTIAAAGYIEVFEGRYSPAPPSASFHPYPGYFDLFPFAVIGAGNIPVFGLTNSIDEIFGLLGINREDIPADQFGFQRLGGVAAVFDNFTMRYFAEDIGFVSAELISIVDDWDGDSWEFVQADFVLVTDGANTVEPTELRVGDEFLGITLTRIESSQVYKKNGEVYRQLMAEAEFSGQISLYGDVSIRLYFDSDYRAMTEFIIADDNLHLIPRIADFGDGFNALHVVNSDELMSALGVERNELDTARNIELPGRYALFEVYWVSSFGYVANFIVLRE